MYPALHRLEADGLLSSQWSKASGRRPSRLQHHQTRREGTRCEPGALASVLNYDRGGIAQRGGNRMTYLDALESELKADRNPPRVAGLGSSPSSPITCTRTLRPSSERPRELARQFADELGTRLARITAYRAFGVLAGSRRPCWWSCSSTVVARGVAGLATVVTRPALTCRHGGSPLMVVWFISAQVALAAGSLALLRAWRLRHQSVITASNAAILNRRAAVGLAAGGRHDARCSPATDLMLARPLAYPNEWHSLFAVTEMSWWGYVAIIGGPLLIVAMVSTLRSVLAAARMRPHRGGRRRRPHAGSRRAGHSYDFATHRTGAKRRDRPRDAGDRHRLKRSARWARTRFARRWPMHDRLHRPRRLS